MPHTFTITQTITLEQVSSLLCSAFEGGSNYWYMIEEKINPTIWTFESEPKPEKGNHWVQDYPLNRGGALLISDKEDKDHRTYRLDLNALQQGLKSMAEKDPHHITSILSEDADAETGDVFLQHCLFGEIVYC